MNRKQHYYRAAWCRAAFAALLFHIPHALQSQSTTVYDLRTDWSDSSNPNGPWSYNDGGGPILNHVVDYSPGNFSVLQPAWVYAPSGQGRIVSWFRATGNGIDTDWQVGDVVTHSWDSASSGEISTPDANVTWTSSGSGTIDLSGGVWLTRDIERSVDWSLAINGQAVSGGSMYSGDPFDRLNPFNLAAGSGGAGVLDDVGVAPGDQIVLSFITRSEFGDLIGVNFHVEFATVPEPSTYALIIFGALAFLVRSKLRGDRTVS